MSLLPVSSVAAQEENTTSIHNYSARPVFPQGVWFQFAGSVPVDSTIAALELEITAEGQTPVRIVIPRDDEDVFTQQGSRFGVSYVWLFPNAQAAPMLFTEVAYEWTLAPVGGSAVMVSDTFVFRDERLNWTVAEASDTMPVMIAADADGEIDPFQVQRLVRPMVDLLAENAGLPQTPVRVVAYPEGVAVGCNLGADGETIVFLPDTDQALPCEPSLAETIYEQSGYNVLEDPSLFDLRQVITTTLFQESYIPLWAGVEVPDWFQIGLLRLYTGSQNAQYLPPVQAAARSNRLLSLQALAEAPSLSSENYPLWEAQSYGLVVYIAERHGVNVLFELAAVAADYDDFAQAYESVTGGEGLSSLLAEWTLWIFTAEAPQVYNVDLYGLPTAVPTETPVPATRPPTSTLPPPPTATPTVTPTATGPTPLPTLTQTPIPPTRTPSLTPRPASSVFTPTPSPTPIPDFLGDLAEQSSLLWVFVGMIGIAVIMIGTAVLSLRRDR